MNTKHMKGQLSILFILGLLFVAGDVAAQYSELSRADLKGAERSQVKMGEIRQAVIAEEGYTAEDMQMSLFWDENGHFSIAMTEHIVEKLTTFWNERIEMANDKEELSEEKKAQRIQRCNDRIEELNGYLPQ